MDRAKLAPAVPQQARRAMDDVNGASNQGLGVGSSNQGHWTGTGASSQGYKAGGRADQGYTPRGGSGGLGYVGWGGNGGQGLGGGTSSGDQGYQTGEGGNFSGGQQERGRVAQAHGTVQASYGGMSQGYDTALPHVERGYETAPPHVGGGAGQNVSATNDLEDGKGQGVVGGGWQGAGSDLQGAGDDAQADLLLSVLDCQLHQVVPVEDRLVPLAEGPLLIVSREQPEGRMAVTARVGEAQEWRLCGEVQCLRTQPLQYVFRLASGAILGITLPLDAPTEAVDLLELLLAECCTYAIQPSTGDSPSASKPGPSDGPAAPTGGTALPAEAAAPAPAATVPDVPPGVCAGTLVPVIDTAGHQVGEVQPVTGAPAPPGGRRIIGERLADLINHGAVVIGDGIIAGGDLATRRIHEGGHYLRSRSMPTDRERQLSPAVVQGAAVARQGAKLMSSASKKLVGGVVYVTGGAARAVGSAAGGLQIDTGLGVRAVALASVAGVSHLLDCVETAGKAVLGHGADVSREVVTHMYGAQAGGAVRDSMSAIGYLVHAGWTMRKLTYKTIARGAARRAAVQVVRGDRRVSNGSQSMARGSGGQTASLEGLAAVERPTVVSAHQVVVATDR